MAILLEVIWLRFSKMRQEKYRREFIKTWQPVLVQRALGEQVPLPALELHDTNRFLILWLHLQESLLGEPGVYLNAVMQEVGMSQALKSRLVDGSQSDQMIAIAAYGFLEDEHVWGELENLLHSPTVALSISSARSLVKIDAAKATPIVIPLIAERRDWPAQKIARILKESPAGFVDAFLTFVEKTMRENHPSLIRLLRLLNVLHLNESPLFIREILSQSEDAELVLAALKLVREPRDLDLVRQRMADGAWQIKVQAVKALGRLGEKDDVPALTSMLHSKDWWLRYRAAASINSMTTLDHSDVNHIKKNLTDPYAQEMLAYATASKGA